MLKRPVTQKIFESLCKVLPGGVNSPVRSCKSMHQLPMVVASALGDQLIDVDGFSYVDYCCSWGSLIHGHANPAILEAVSKRMVLGTSYGITTPIEGEIAREAIKLVPSIEKIRFVSSGTEATMSALRLARGFTNRDYVVKFVGNYHGHADFLLVQAGSGVIGLSKTSSSAGIPYDAIKHTISLPYNDVKAVKSYLQDPEFRDRIAAVILEPVAGNMGVVPATQEFLTTLRIETARIGALLIFDEVITGFRVAIGGAQSLFGIKPDLTCLGKIIGGGFPVAAFGGRAEIMDFLAPEGPVYQAGTLSGNPVAMAAGLESLKLLQQPGFYENLQKKAHIITQPVAELLKKKKANACVQQVGSMFSLFFGQSLVLNMDDAHKINSGLFVRFFQFLFENGVYIPPSAHESWFISSAHQESHLEKTRDLILKFINENL
jgi:glutamate-1-semialdehyde 2,1-aminomutase